MASKQHAVVIGAGVIGLTTSILLQMSGRFKVTIVSKSSPDPKHYNNDPYYASREAGAHWCSFAAAEDKRLQEFEMVTFKTFMELAQYPETGVKTMKSICLSKHGAEEYEEPWFASVVTGFRVLGNDEIPAHSKFGYEFETFTINVPKYLRWLLLRFHALGGEVVIDTVRHVNDLAKYEPAVIVNCTGYGSRSLFNDTEMYPTRGQTILVKGLHVNTINRLPDVTERISAYIIPRDDETVLLGGTFEVGSVKLAADPLIAQEIFEQCKILSPEFRNSSDSVKIIRHGVGIRPTRKGGIRLEAHDLSLKSSKTTIVHNYGHGSYGYQSSWGSAEEAVRLALQHTRGSPISREASKL